MPLTELQRLVIRALRPFRSEDNYIGGGAALNQRWPRLSDDMDIFGDNRQSLPSAPKPELEALEAAGFTVEVTTHDEWMVEAVVRQYGFETRIQWLDDDETSRRFFPAIYDEELGFRLHPADAAMNKVLCAARRHGAPRDAVDLLSIVERYAPLGPLIWALSSKDEKLTPNVAITRIRNIAFGYSDQEIRAVRMAEGSIVTRQQIRDVLGKALDAAAEYCDDVAPDEHLGKLLVDGEFIPVEATSRTIADGLHSPMTIREFGRLPQFSDQTHER